MTTVVYYVIPSNIPAKLQNYLKITHNRLQAVYSTVIISIREAIICQIAAEVLRSARYLGNSRLVFGEHPLPGPFFIGIRIFFLQGIGKRCPFVSFCQILVMQLLHSLQMGF